MKPGSILAKACWILKYQGLAELCKRAWRYIKKHKLIGLWRNRNNAAAYRRWLKNEAVQVNKKLMTAPEDIESFNYHPVISIVMPVHNTTAKYLEKAIDSVSKQVYPYWELCIADDASTEPHVPLILNRYCETDSRIKVAFLSNRDGIVGAGNSAINLSTGDYICFLDHDDELSPHALLEIVRCLNVNPVADIIYTDEDRLIGDGLRAEPFFKPDWSPDLLMSMNYVGHLTVVRRTLIEKTGGFTEGTDGSQDYDLILRLSELTKNIIHIPQVLYHWRMTPGSVSSVAESRLRALEVGREAIVEALGRRGINGRVTLMENGYYRVQYHIKDDPLISIIIPTRDRIDLLRRCLESIQRKSTYHNYEIIVVDNGSTDEETLKYLHEIKKTNKCFVLRYDEPFNYSRINNYAVQQASGEYLLFLNNDTEVISEDWLEEMLSHAQRPEIGAVGVKLLFPDKRIQHGGVLLGIGGIAGHAVYGLPDSSPGYMNLANVSRNCSAVTAACLAVGREVFEEVGGFDEELDVAYNDVDLCLRILEQGYFNVWTPYAVLYHYESATRGHAIPEENVEYFCRKWRSVIERGDYFYNPNLSLNHCDYQISC